MRRGLVAGALAVAGAIGLLAWGGAFATGSSGVSPGSPAPDFRAVTLDASPRPKGIADYRGQVVLLNLWATWCGPCEWEMPSLEALHRDFAPQGLRVVAVAVDDPGFEQRVRDFVARKGLTFEILSEGSGKIEADYEARGIPATYLIGKDGLIRKRVAGASDWNTPANRALVAQLLGGSATPP
ncbi:MAG: TlpA family protein disulfide reductase [Gemmatimonadaceae bacterium]|nr:TlpA family protein disulfide reductase [Gemmatimonadaceae bacterium]